MTKDTSRDAVAVEQEIKRLRQVKAALHIRTLAKENGWDPKERDDLLEPLGLKDVKGRKQT